jgi:hypothetical protein
MVVQRTMVGLEYDHLPLRTWFDFVCLQGLKAAGQALVPLSSVSHACLSNTPRYSHHFKDNHQLDSCRQPWAVHA